MPRPSNPHAQRKFIVDPPVRYGIPQSDADDGGSTSRSVGAQCEGQGSEALLVGTDYCALKLCAR
jgi:hypothetical protein